MQCELCSTTLPNKIWENSHFYVLNASTTTYPVFLRLVCKTHIKEMTDLPLPVFTHMCRLMRTIEKTVIEYTHCEKVNWAQFGCVVPHLHWHCIARWQDDVNFPATPWNDPVRTISPRITQTRLSMNDILLPHLSLLLTQVPRP